MEEIEKYIEELKEDWEFKKPILEELRGLKYPFPNYQNFNGEPSIGKIEYRYDWYQKPLLVYVYHATLEQTHEVLRVIREKYGCFWTMDTWETSKRVTFDTFLKIGDNKVRISVHLINVKECTWEPVEKKSIEYQINCQ